MSRDDDVSSNIPPAPPLAPLLPSFQLPRHITSGTKDIATAVRMRQKELQFKIVGAIEGQDLGKVQRLTELGVNVNAAILYTKTPLTYALELGYENIALYLLQHGADPNISLNTEARQSPVHLATSHNCCEVLRELKLREVDMDKEDGAKMTPLHYAAYHGFVEVFNELVSSKVVIDYKDMSGKTPFHRAVEQRHFFIAEKLLQLGANIDEQDIFGWPPLFHAVIYNDIEMVHFLLQNKCDVHIRDLKGNTALVMGCNRFKLDSMKIMARTSFDYYKRTKMIPTEKQAGILYRKDKVNVFMIKELVNAGFDTDIQNNSGERALYHSTYACERDVVEHLVLAGTWIDPEWLHLIQQATDVSEERSQIHSWLVSQHEFQYLLTNQCRRAVRKFLAQTRNIMQSIHKLPLPEKMQTFLQAY